MIFSNTYTVQYVFAAFFVQVNNLIYFIHSLVFLIESLNMTCVGQLYRLLKIKIVKTLRANGATQIWVNQRNVRLFVSEKFATLKS